MSTALVKPEIFAQIGPVDPPLVVVPGYDIPHAAATAYSWGFESYASQPVTVVYTEGFATSKGGWAWTAPATSDYQWTTGGRTGGRYTLYSETTNYTGKAVRTFSGLTVGRSYTFSAWAGDSTTARQARIGVTGIGSSAWTSGWTATYSWKQITYTFTATATSHELVLETSQLASGTISNTLDWDDVSLQANLYVTNTGLDGWAGSGTTLVFGVGPYATHSGSYSLQWTKNAATVVVRTVTGLTVGRSYTLSAWARASTAKAAQVGVTGIGSGTAVTLPVNAYTQVSYTFTATATSHELQIINVSTGAYLWDDILLVRDAWIEHVPPVTTPFAPLPISEGRIALDENYSPYSMATVDVPLSSLEILERIDPRDGQRVQILAGDTVGDTSREFDLGLRGRTVDHKTGRVSLELATDEALLMDKRRLAATADSSSRAFESSLRGVCNWALGKIDATLLSGTADADVTAAWDATNLQTNPSAGTDLTGWVASGGTIGRTTGGIRPPDGTLSNIRATMTAGATGGLYFAGGDDSTVAGGAYNVAIRENQLYRVSAWVRTSVSKTIRLSTQQRNATNTQPGANHNGPAFTTTANTWHRLSFVFQAYPGAIRVGLYAYLASGTYAAGETIDITGVTITEGTLDVPYFDGSTNGGADARYTYTWNGTAHLSVSNRRAVVPRPPELFDWKPGQSLWAFLKPLTEAAGLRLFCDEQRNWRLIDPAEYEVPGYVIVQSQHNATEGTDTISRNTDDWATGALVTYRWIDAEGTQREAFDFAGTDDKVLTVERRSEYPGPGAAAYILNSLTGRGRVQDVTALVDFRATPTNDVSIDLPGTVKQTGKVRRVTFGLKSGLMEVGTRGLIDTLDGSWAAWNPAQTWSAVNPTLAWKDA